jgi:hypothetical protein
MSIFDKLKATMVLKDPPKPEGIEPEALKEVWEPIDYDTLIERVGIKYDIPAIGKPVLAHPQDGRPLAFEGDPPHVRLFAWCLINVPPGGAVHVDTSKAAKDCQLRSGEVREALAQLVREGDLVRTMERGRELFRLNIQY